MALQSPALSPETGSQKAPDEGVHAYQSPLSDTGLTPLKRTASGLNKVASASPSLRQASPKQEIPKPMTAYSLCDSLPNIENMQLPQVIELFKEWSFRISQKREQIDVLVKQIQSLASKLAVPYAGKDQSQLEFLIRRFQIAELEYEQLEADIEAIDSVVDRLENYHPNLTATHKDEIAQLSLHQQKKLKSLLEPAIQELEQRKEDERKTYRSLSEKKYDFRDQRFANNLDLLQKQIEASSRRLEELSNRYSNMYDLREELDKTPIAKISKVAFREIYQELLPMLSNLTKNVKLIRT